MTVVDERGGRDGTSLSAGGRPLHGRLVGNTARLARAMVDRFVETIPIYRQLPREELDGDITMIVERNIQLVSKVLRERRPPTAADLAEPVASAARRAQEGVPLGDVLTAYHTGIQMAAEFLFADATPDDSADVIAAHRLMFQYLRAVTAAVATSYLREREGMLAQEQHAQHSLVSALLRGEPPTMAGARAATPLASRYLVLTLRIDTHPDEDQPGPGAAIAGRRKLHRLRAELELSAGGRVLSVLDPTGGLVLLPVTDVSDLTGTPWDWTAATDLAARLREAAGVDIIGAGEFAPPAEVADAATLTREILDVVRAFRRPPGLYRLADVLLEYQLTRPGAAMRSLAALLDPLAEHPDLLHTLDVYLEHKLDRRHTAAVLHIHPNTVDYRLRKATRLTGLRYGDPADLQRIGAALAVRRFMATRGPSG